MEVRVGRDAGGAAVGVGAVVAVRAGVRGANNSTGSTAARWPGRRPASPRSARSRIGPPSAVGDGVERGGARGGTGGHTVHDDVGWPEGRGARGRGVAGIERGTGLAEVGVRLLDRDAAAGHGRGRRRDGRDLVVRRQWSTRLQTDRRRGGALVKERGQRVGEAAEQAARAIRQVHVEVEAGRGRHAAADGQQHGQGPVGHAQVPQRRAARRAVAQVRTGLQDGVGVGLAVDDRGQHREPALAALPRLDPLEVLESCLRPSARQRFTFV